MKKHITALLIGTAVILGLSACAAPAAPAAPASAPPAAAAPADTPAAPVAEASQVTLLLNHVQSSMDPVHAAFEAMAERVYERSGGSIEIIVYGNSELGSNRDNLEQLRLGANIISVADPALMADYVADYGIMNGPFLLQSNDDLQLLYNSDWHREIEAAASEQGIKILAMNWFFGPRHLISRTPVESVEDMSGLLVRIPSAQMWAETFDSLGAIPTTLQWAEVYSALEQGVVDAAEAPLSTIYTSRLHEAAGYLTLTGHFTGIVGLQMSQDIWDSMSTEQQEILAEAVAYQGAIYSQDVMNSVEDYKNRLIAEGVTVIEVDLASFAEAARATFERFPEWTPGLYERVLAEIGR